MDFLLICPEGEDLPWQETTVAATAARASAPLLERLGAPGFFVAETAPRFRLPGGFVSVRPDEAAARLRNLPEEARGIALAAGVCDPPLDRLEAMLGGSPGERPEPLLNQAGHVVAVSWTARVAADALAPTFDETVAGVELPRRASRVLGVQRIRDAASWTDALRTARRQTARGLLLAGVLLEDPDTLWADSTCAVAAGVRIGPAVTLLGRTRIAAGAEISAFCRLEDTEVGPGARVLSHTTVTGATLRQEARVGPHAHVRQDTVLEPGARAGAFTETKQTVLGRGASLSHLAYLGDADLGEQANVGAGAITCNFDGRRKRRTLIEAGAFVGSNVTLVAPVRIGRGAFVAAGSVVVDDVPDGAMAIARGRQELKPGRAAGRFRGADAV